MPKARKRKRVPVQKNTQKAQQASIAQKNVSQAASTRKTVSNRPFFSPRVVGPQSLLWPGMVALGCWGMAFSFLVFSNDPNHMLFGGMAALLALLWSFSVAMRVRKLLAIRRNS